MGMLHSNVPFQTPNRNPMISQKPLDGVSLTVNEVEDESDGAVTFGVNIIPHTAERTTLGGLEPGARVNREIDLLARYVQRLLNRA